MERRKSKRHSIFVDIEVARPEVGRCCGFAENISREGMYIVLDEGYVPDTQRSVILSFKIWTGNETLFRKMVGRIARYEGSRLALEFSEYDFMSEAVIHDLIYHQARMIHLNSEHGTDIHTGSSLVGDRLA